MVVLSSASLRLPLPSSVHRPSSSTSTSSVFFVLGKKETCRGNLPTKFPSFRVAAFSSSSSSFQPGITFSVPLVASLAILLWSTPVDAGILSGFSGLESVPGPELPQIDFLSKWSEDNQKRYSELDSKFKSSTVLKQLLEKSKLNKERNQRMIQDKYCIRGAEWGVGDCSTQGMTQEEKDDFISALKKRAEGE